MEYSFAAQMTGLGWFVAYFALTLALTGLYLKIYCWMTPHNELDLIRKGVTSAAIGLGGSLIGFTLPLASAVAHSVSILDCLLWGIVALLVQIAVYKIWSRIIPDISKRLEDGDMAAGIALACFSIAAGILNAACMSY